MSGRAWGRIVIGALLICIGIGWLLQTAGIIDFPLRALTPIALIVVGLGLIAGARRGSHPWLIVLGVVLTVFLTIGSTTERRVGELDLGSGVGNRVVRPLNSAELRPFEADAGQITVDLTQFRLRMRTYHVRARVGAGQIRVIVPPDVPFRVDARTGAGTVTVLGDRLESGVGVDQVYTSSGYAGARPRFNIDVRAAVGSIVVTQGY